jgi:hypothetical protein
MGTAGRWLADQYVAALALAPVHVVAKESGRPIRISTAREAAAAGHALTVWCTSDLWAIELAISARTKLAGSAFERDADRRWIDATAEDARAVLDLVASEVGIVFFTAEKISQSAAEVMARVEIEFTRMQAAGELRALNRSYREYRLACNAAGSKAMHYTKWIAQKKARMFRSAVEVSRFTSRII